MAVGAPGEDLSEIGWIDGRYFSYRSVSILCPFKLFASLRHLYLSQRAPYPVIRRPRSHMLWRLTLLLPGPRLLEVDRSLCLSALLLGKVGRVVILLLLTRESLKLVCL